MMTPLHPAMLSKFMEAKTQVFLYIDDCKVPEDIGPYITVKNIRSAVTKMGYRGRLYITAYGDIRKIHEDTRKLLAFAGVTLVDSSPRKRVTNYERIAEVWVDVFTWKMVTRGLSNLLLVTQDLSGIEEFIRLVQVLLHSAGECNVLLAQPTFTSGPEELNVLATEWLWSSLAAGGDPIIQTQGADKCSSSGETT